MMTNKSDKDNVYIERLDSKVAKSSKIKNGDQILKINNIEAKNKDLVNSILKKSEALELKLLIGRPNLNHDHQKCKDRFAAKRLQTINWCSSNQSSDCNDHEYAEIIFEDELENQHFEDIFKQSSNTLNCEQVSKENKVDKGSGRTDNDSIHSHSTDNDITAPIQANHIDSSLSTYQPDLSQNDMINHKIAKVQKRFENLNRHIDDDATSSTKQAPTFPVRTVNINQSKRSSLSLLSSANALNLRSSQEVAVESKMAPKVFPKVKLMSEKSKSIFSRKESSNLSHLLTEVQSFEKKESIRKWIKKGLSQQSNYETQQFKSSIAPVMPSNDKNRKPNDQEYKSDSNLVSYTYSESNDCVINSSKSTKKEAMSQVQRPEGEALNHEHSSKSKSNVPFFYTTMYTTEANLEQTILLQQQLLRQAILDKQYNGFKNSALTDPKTIICNRSCLHPNNHDGQYKSKVNIEWKVKKRADGSKYIIKKSNQKKMLKQREQPLMQERYEMTPDDDTISQIKVSKSWNKDESKKFVHKSKDKQPKEMQKQTRAAKMEAARDDSNKLKRHESDNLVNTIFNSKSNQNENFCSNLKVTKQSHFVPKQFYNPHPTRSKSNSNDLLTVTIV